LLPCATCLPRHLLPLRRAGAARDRHASRYRPPVA